jgi:hypothetical protein
LDILDVAQAQRVSATKFISQLRSVFPVIRMSAQKHDGKYENSAWFNAVEYSVRETTYETAPEIFFHDRPRGWKADDVSDGGKNLD